ncbi:esterase [Winogradskyella sp. PG-2]|nr:esterase [Winogradskyella sp. PG-2]
MLLCSLFFLNCENKRKHNTVVEKSTHTYRSLNSETLELDYYKPKENKDNLPLLIYVHGGGFANGQRDEKVIVSLAHKLAENGYAKIAVSYRLTRANKDFNCNTSANDKIKTFNEASEDISHALNYVLENTATFKINKDKIVIAGESAGAEAILNLMYTYRDTIIPKEFKFAGLISRAGALTSLDNITSQSAIPTQLFHGENDQLVPYNYGSHHNCNKNEDGYLELYGSKAIVNHLKQLDKPYYLVTFNNGNHGMHGFSDKSYSMEIINFLKSLDQKVNQEQIELRY